ncbi:MAG: toprim domain-containing protein [Betaproteobacteria bacterium]|nr:toprim domain-containing protein [Betaproteobacteria bacterium]
MTWANLDSLHEQMQAVGMPPINGSLTLDRIVRYGPNKRAFYKLYEHRTRDGREFVTGYFGMWGAVEVTKVVIDWDAAGVDSAERQRFREEMAEKQRREDEKRAERAHLAANRARDQWSKAIKLHLAGTTGVSSAYALRKAVHLESCRLAHDGTILVPILRYDAEEKGGRMVGLQKIAQDGTKRFNKNMAMEGGACRLGNIPGDGDVILVVEGFATGLSVRMATRQVLTVFVAFNAGNLKPVAEILRERYPTSPIIFCADDDWKTTKPDGTPFNPGVYYAHVAARAVKRAAVLVPLFLADSRDDKWTDFNDLHLARGLEECEAQLKAIPELVETVCAEKPAEAPAATAQDGPPSGAVWADAVSGRDPHEAAPDGGSGGSGGGGGDGGGDGPPDGISTPPEPDGEPVPYVRTWHDDLQRTKSGALKPTLHNAQLVLQHHDEWQGVLGFDLYGEQVIKLQPPPFAGGATGKWQDIDDVRLKLWFSQRIGEPPDKTVTDAVLLASRRNEFHELKDYLEGCASRWDGTYRLATMMQRYFGACTGEEFTQQTPEEQDEERTYCEKAATKWMVGACRRVFMPGCQMDNMLILEGEQGLMKSTAFSVLGGKWFSDVRLNFKDKDSLLALQGYWIVEMAELEGMNKADTSETKQFLTHRVDFFRPPYGRKLEEKPRRCVFGGTVNLGVYLKDETGNRRFWPVRVYAIDLEQLKADRDQLWGEAMHWMRKDFPHWVLPDERHLFERQQDQRFVEDAWLEPIEKFLDGTALDGPVNEVTMAELLGAALKLDFARQDRQAQTRAGIVMKRLGWKKVKKGSGRRGYVYLRPPSAKPSASPMNSNDQGGEDEPF